MNSKMTTNSQLSKTESEKQKTETKQSTRTGRITEVEITRRIISREGEMEKGGKGTGNKKHK